MKEKSFALIMLLAFAGATSAFAAKATPPDYSDPANWHSLPEITKDADTFYIYPTLYAAAGENDPDYAAIDNPEMVARSRA